MSNYQDLMRKYLGDGARNTRFDIKLSIPSKISNSYNDSRALSIMCKSANLPNRTIQTQNIVFRGRSIPVPVSTKYSNTWTCTFYNDENHNMRKMFELWLDAVDSKNEYTSFTDEMKGLIGDDYIKDEIKIEQYSSISNNLETATPTAVWTLYGVYPTDVSSIELSSESESIQEFTVTFSYTYYEIDIKGNE